MAKRYKSFYAVYGKRAFDIILVLVTLPVWLLICLIVGVFVRVKLGSPVLFRQARGGYLGKEFVLIKFRSMTSEKNEQGDLLPDEKRLPRFGKLLRATSLDEFPTFINVLVGDMSLIGPRPLLVSYLELYDEEQMKRHLMRPGVTGWAQVNGRNAISWEEKFRYDVEYVENVSFWLDLKILWLTFLRVARPKDINSKSHATMELFSGTKKKTNGEAGSSSVKTK